MKISVIGTGYVGLVAGTCFAEYGNDVFCVDIDAKKIENLKNGILPIYEPGLEEMVERNYKSKRLHFTTDLPDAVGKTDLIFIAVGTPDGGDGRADLRFVLKVAEEIGKAMNGYKVIVDKSTVPVGTGDRVRETIKKETKHNFDVVSNPEFLREGCALEDFIHPERVVIGADSKKAGDMMRELYSPFVKKQNNPIIVTDVRSAELTKYACNTFLAMKISFANSIANLCDTLGANYEDVKKGMGTDSRIGNKFLNAGIGYGGSCFPKDVRALMQISQDAGVKIPLIDEIEKTNDKQKLKLAEKLKAHFKNTTKKEITDFKGYKFAVWGLAFKPGTDDMREAPSIPIINELHGMGAEIFAHDPVAVESSEVYFKDKITYCDPYEALKNADALLILTEWPIFLEPDFDLIKKNLKTPLIFDGRNSYDPQMLKELGFVYYGIGIQQK